MFEPVSGIGFVLGCISFLISSLPNLYQKERQITQCREFLENFERQLRNIQAKYDSWRKVWGGLSAEQYQQAWGVNNVARVRNWIRAIDDLFKRVEEEVRGPLPAQHTRFVARLRRSGVREEPDLARSSDFIWWTRVVERFHNRSPLSGDENVRDVGVIYRIAFAFFKNDVLKLNVDNLTRTVDDLDRFTTYEWWKLRWSYTKPSPTPDEVTRSLGLQSIRSEYSLFARLLLERQNVKNSIPGNPASRQWSLELRLPDLRGDPSDLGALGRIDLDFCLADQLSRPPTDLKRATIIYSPRVVPLADEILSQRIDEVLEQLYQELEGDAWHGSCSLRDDGFRSLSSASRRSISLRMLFAQDVAHDVATTRASTMENLRLMVGLVNWTLLLWLTDWTAEPCCCRIRALQLGGSTRAFTLSIGEHSCEENTQYGGKIVSLGVALAEIILATPVRVRPNVTTLPDIIGTGFSRATLRRIEKRQPGPLGIGGRWRPIQLSQLLQEIKETLDLVGAPHSLVEAVGFCLSNPTFSSQETFSIEALEECTTKVLKPIQERLRIITAHRRRFASRDWWRARPWPPEGAFETPVSNAWPASSAMPGTFPGPVGEAPIVAQQQLKTGLRGRALTIAGLAAIGCHLILILTAVGFLEDVIQLKWLQHIRASLTDPHSEWEG